MLWLTSTLTSSVDTLANSNSIAEASLSLFLRKSFMPIR